MITSVSYDLAAVNEYFNVLVQVAHNQIKPRKQNSITVRFATNKFALHERSEYIIL